MRCGSIEHKMGIHGNVDLRDEFRRRARAGWSAQPNKGLNAMFMMMNTARLAVGMQGLGLTERAYQNALAYARERLQMRALSGAEVRRTSPPTR